MSTIRVAAVQMEPILGQIDHNLHTLQAGIREAARNDARLVVFPECALTGYGFESRDEALPFAQTLPGPSIDVFAQLCRETGSCVIYGLLEKAGEKLFNALALVGPDGLIGTYRKVHLPYLGVDRYADPGDQPFAVHEAAGLRVGMQICYDGAFPEAGRVLSLLGADLLVLPTNWPTHAESAARHLMAVRALENTVYAMAVDRVGEERGFRFIGQSSIWDPNGEELAYASPDQPEILYADIDPARARDKTLTRVPGLHVINRIADRRPGFYSLIVAPNGRD